MNDRIQIVSIIGSLVIMGFVVELVRQRRLRVEYSILWLVAGACLVSLSVFRDVLDRLGTFVGVAYPPAALFLAALCAGAAALAARRVTRVEPMRVLREE